MHVFIYTKSKTMRNVYIYIQKSRHFSKSMTLCVTFLFTKRHTFCVTQFFMNFFKLASINIYKEHVTLRYNFFYKISLTLRKKEDNLGYVFLYTKSLTLCVTQFFMEFLKLAEGGGIFIHKKSNTLRHIFI